MVYRKAPSNIDASDAIINNNGSQGYLMSQVDMLHTCLTLSNSMNKCLKDQLSAIMKSGPKFGSDSVTKPAEICNVDYDSFEKDIIHQKAEILKGIDAPKMIGSYRHVPKENENGEYVSLVATSYVGELANYILDTAGVDVLFRISEAFWTTMSCLPTGTKLPKNGSKVEIDNQRIEQLEGWLDRITIPRLDVEKIFGSIVHKHTHPPIAKDQQTILRGQLLQSKRVQEETEGKLNQSLQIVHTTHHHIQFLSDKLRLLKQEKIMVNKANEKLQESIIWKDNELQSLIQLGQKNEDQQKTDIEKLSASRNKLQSEFNVALHELEKVKEQWNGSNGIVQRLHDKVASRDSETKNLKQTIIDMQNTNDTVSTKLAAEQKSTAILLEKIQSQDKMIAAIPILEKTAESLLKALLATTKNMVSRIDEGDRKAISLLKSQVEALQTESADRLSHSQEVIRLNATLKDKIEELELALKDEEESENTLMLELNRLREKTSSHEK